MAILNSELFAFILIFCFLVDDCIRILKVNAKIYVRVTLNSNKRRKVTSIMAVGDLNQGIFVLKLFGDLIIARLPGIRDKVDFLQLENYKYILIDLSEVNFIDSSGLGYLVMLMKQIKQNDGRVCIFCPKDWILKQLKMIKLDSYVSIYQDQSEAFSELAVTEEPA